MLKIQFIHILFSVKQSNTTLFEIDNKSHNAFVGLDFWTIDY